MDDFDKQFLVKVQETRKQCLPFITENTGIVNSIAQDGTLGKICGILDLDLAKIKDMIPQSAVVEEIKQSKGLTAYYYLN